MYGLHKVFIGIYGTPEGCKMDFRGCQKHMNYYCFCTWARPGLAGMRKHCSSTRFSNGFEGGSEEAGMVRQNTQFPSGKQGISVTSAGRHAETLL